MMTVREPPLNTIWTHQTSGDVKDGNIEQGEAQEGSGLEGDSQGPQGGRVRKSFQLQGDDVLQIDGLVSVQEVLEPQRLERQTLLLHHVCDHALDE